MEVHPDAAGVESYLLDLEPKPLLPLVRAVKGDSPSGGHHPMPGELRVGVQCPDGEPGSPRKPR